MCAHTNMRCWATIALLSCAALTGCGGGSSVVGQGPGLGNSSNNALLQGQYAFALSGQDSNGLFLMVGTFAADGNGHLAGSEDVNSSSLTSRGSGVPFSGTYAIGSDGRGNAVLGIQPGCPNWQFTMLNHSHGLLTCLNTNITGSGTIDLADPRAFSISALKGNYVFGFSGLGASAGFAVTAGSWSMDGGGTVNAGIADVNDAGTVSQALSLSGSYSVASTGRGTATISSHYATQNFVFYIVNATDIKFMESDSTAGVPRVSGEVLNQAPVFTTSSLSGTYPFTLGGIDANQNALALGGLLSADGNGNIFSGLMDVNDAGNIMLGASLTGTYSVGASGRGVATLSSPVFAMAFYAAANGTLEVVNLSQDFVASGMARRQTGGAFGTDSVAGNYAVNFSGTNFGSNFAGGGEEDISGRLTGDGAGTLTGTLDVNNSGSISQALPLSASSYTMTSTGRGTASLNTPTGTFALEIYEIDPNNLMFLDVDSNRVVLGLGEKQAF